MDNIITDALSLQLTRREFLIKAGIIILTITGLSVFLKKTILPSFPDKTTKAAKGFGTEGYGS